MSRFPGMGMAPNTIGTAASLTNNPFRGPVTGMEGVAGGLPGMALGMAMQSLGGGMGMTPLGMGPQNVYDRMRQQQMTQDYQRFLGEMSERDRGGYRETATGVANMLGIRDTAQRRNFIETTAGLGVKFGGVAAQMAPEMLDAAMGQRGSAAVMAHEMYYGGRLRVDPVTGRAGLGQESMRALGENVFGQMFEGGFYRNGTGLSAGQTGAAFRALQAQGMIAGTTPMAGLRNMATTQPGDFRQMLREAIQDTVEAEPNRPDLQRYLKRPIVPGGVAELRDDVGGVGDLKGLSPDILDRAAQTLEGSTAIRKFDSSRVIQSLKDYGGAIKAMREIFGDAGNPNAPMPELIDGLQALTGNSMSKLQPGTVEQMARTTYNLAKGAGVGMPGIAMMSASAQAQAMAMGLDPVFGARAVQHGLSTMQAFQQGGYGANPAWGKGNMGEIVSIDQQLTLAAAESDAFNQASVAERFTRTQGEFAQGSRAAEYMEAWRNGRTTFGANGESIVMEDEAFVSMLVQSSGGKISRAQAVSMMRQRKTNAQYGFERGYDFTTRKVQSAELDRQLANQPMAQAIETSIGGLDLKGVSTQEQRILSEVMAGGAADTLRNMSSEDIANDKARQAAVAQTLQTQLEALKAGGGPGSKAAAAVLARYDGKPLELAKFMATTGENLWGETNNWAARNTIFKSAQNMYAVSNPTMMAAAENRRDQAAIESQLQSAMAPLGKESILRSAVEAIQNVKPEDADSIKEVFLASLGGVKGADAIARIAGEPGKDGGPSILDALYQRRAALDKKSQDLRRTKDPKKRAQLKKEIGEELKSLNDSIGSLGELAESQGMFLKSPITRSSVAEIIREQNYVTKALEEGGGLATGAISKEDFAEGVEREQMSAMGLVAQISGDEKLAMRLGATGADAMETIIKSQEGMSQAAAATGYSAAAILGASDAELKKMGVSKAQQNKLREYRTGITTSTAALYDVAEGKGEAFKDKKTGEERISAIRDKVESQGEDVFRYFVKAVRPEGADVEKYIKAQKATVDRLNAMTPEGEALRQQYRSAAHDVQVATGVGAMLKHKGIIKSGEEMYSMSDEDITKSMKAGGYSEKVIETVKRGRTYRGIMRGEMDEGGIEGVKGLDRGGLDAVERASGGSAAQAAGDKDAAKLAGGGTIKIEIATLNVKPDGGASMGGKYGGGATA